MRIGVTGHQIRAGIDWRWVRTSIKTQLSSMIGVTNGYSSLAIGADQIFAEILLELQIHMCSVIPLPQYERFFHGEGLEKYEYLLARSDAIFLASESEPSRAFFEAGQYIVRESDILFAVWDGKPAQGVGGTGDVVSYARQLGKAVLHFDTSKEAVEFLN
ncbi:MAG: hypothetical protein WBQ17_05765 [Rhizomicrobium sp.]